MSRPISIPFLLSLALLALGPLTNVASRAADSTPQTAPPATPATPGTPAPTLTDEEKAITAAAENASNTLDQLRADIRGGKTEATDTALASVDTQLDAILGALPTADARERINDAKKHLVTAAVAGDVLPDLAPIGAALDGLVEVMPVEHARRHLDQTRLKLVANDKAGADASLDATLQALRITEVDLPVNVTRQALADAQKALAANDTATADRTLAQAQDSLVYLSVVTRQSLFRAKAMLWRALLDFRKSDTAQAQTDLATAIWYLNTASHDPEKATREAAVHLLPQAEQFQSALADDSDTAAQLVRLWMHTKALADRSVQYMVAGWKRYSAPNAYKASLIEANLHLTNARINRFMEADPIQARQELDAAQQFLNQAALQAQQHPAPNADPGKFPDLQKALAGIMADPINSGLPAYNDLGDKLETLIEAM